MGDNFFKTKGIFRGYVRLNGKGSIDKYKDKNKPLPNFELVEKDYHNYAGVLADDIILIDVDNEEQANKLFNIVEDLDLKCNVLQTTRGKHFYFKNTDVNKCAKDKNLACGVVCDIKVGCSNSYGALRYDGIKREILKEVEDIQELPKFLKPINHTMDFMNMQEGDGRNQSLFNYILTLQSEGLSKEEIRQTIRIINKYILKDPLNDKEIETILRDDSFKKQIFYNGKTFLHEKLAKFMIAENNIVEINNKLCIYKDGYYSNYEKDIHLEIMNIIENTKEQQRNEVIKTLKLIAPTKECSSPQYICVNNGIYDLETNQLLENNQKYIITNKIPYNYNSNAYNELVDKTLNKICCNNQDLRKLLEEMIGYTFYRTNELGKSFILVGYGSNGKSTLLAMIEKLLGVENYEKLSLEDFKDKFRLQMIDGKLACIGDDIEGGEIKKSSNFKKVVTGDGIVVEEKGQNPYKINPYCKLIFCANEIPHIKDFSYGLMRRLIIIPFNAIFTKQGSSYDPYIKYKLTTNEAMEYLLRLGIEGLERVLMNNGFTDVDVVKKEIEKYKKENNPVLGFLDENDVENQGTNDSYLRFKVWCNENGYNNVDISHSYFSKMVCKEKNYETKPVKLHKSDKKKCRAFVKKKE